MTYVYWMLGIAVFLWVLAGSRPKKKNKERLLVDAQAWFEADQAGIDDGRKRAKKREVLELVGDGSYRVRAVGVSHYQKNFERVVGRRCRDGYDEDVSAVLVLEDNNRYDENAVMVQVEGRKLGYLSRSDAVWYRRLLESIDLAGENLYCKARINGGWYRGRGDQGSFGIGLDIPPMPKQRKPAKKRGKAL